MTGLEEALFWEPSGLTSSLAPLTPCGQAWELPRQPCVADTGVSAGAWLNVPGA